MAWPQGRPSWRARRFVIGSDLGFPPVAVATLGPHALKRHAADEPTDTLMADESPWAPDVIQDRQNSLAIAKPLPARARHASLAGQSGDQDVTHYADISGGCDVG
jgi:hypothetical protein